MSDTPRTDAFCKGKYDGASAAAYNGTPDQSPEDAYGDAVEFARQLERENAQLVESLDWALRRIRTSLDVGEYYEKAELVLRLAKTEK